MPTGNSIRFAGVVVKKGEIKDSEVGAALVLHCVGDLTEDVVEEMEWTAPDNTSKKSEMVGSLGEGNMVLTPVTEAFAKDEIQFSFFQADKFVIIAKEKKDGSRKQILQFNVYTNAPESPAAVFEFKRAMKSEKSTLKLSFSSQEDLPI